MAEVTDQPYAQIIEIKKRFDADPDGFLAATTDLCEVDFALMGKLIQLYCYADLNARRIIDSLRHAMFGPEARCASRLQDAQVFPKLREVVSELWDSNLKEGVLKAVDTVEMHRIHRHNFAHWAARRVAAKRRWFCSRKTPVRQSGATAKRKTRTS